MAYYTQAFVYKWTHIPTSKWYIGSRTSVGCHPDDGYICSSKIVKPMILESKNEWTREIIATGAPEEMRALEYTLLETLNAKDDPNSFNLHNGNGKIISIAHTEETKLKISASCTGKPKNTSAQGIERRLEGLRLAVLGKPQSEEHKAKRSAAMSGKTQSEEHKAKRSAALKKYHLNKRINMNTPGVIQ